MKGQNLYCRRNSNFCDTKLAIMNIIQYIKCSSFITDTDKKTRISSDIAKSLNFCNDLNTAQNRSKFFCRLQTYSDIRVVWHNLHALQISRTTASSNDILVPRDPQGCLILEGWLRWTSQAGFQTVHLLLSAKDGIMSPPIKIFSLRWYFGKIVGKF